MGFHKRYIRKEMILENVSNIPYVSRLVKADALIMDTWSDNFFKNFDFKWKTYNEMREKLNDDTKFDSHSMNKVKHENFNKLKNLSNILLNLKTNPSWVDIDLVGEILSLTNKDISEEISGRFDELVKYHIKLIEESYG